MPSFLFSLYKKKGAGKKERKGEGEAKRKRGKLVGDRGTPRPPFLRFFSRRGEGKKGGERGREERGG